MRGLCLLAVLFGMLGLATAAHSEPYVSEPYVVVQDGIPKPIAAQRGDPARGRAIVANRSVGLCLLCHSGPIPVERFQGNLAPSLGGAGTRSSESQLRLRIVDAARINPDTIMPPYFRTDGLRNVAKPFAGKTLLTAQQVEDVVAYLVTLKD
jgi:sulfur-oxidizing protein SoxX